MTRIGITGHQQLGDHATAAWIHTALDRVLGEHGCHLVGVSSLAAGVDQVFAELVLERRGCLEAVLPFPGYRERALVGDLQRYDQLVGHAQVEVLTRDARSEEEAYLHAGRVVVAHCDLLIAVWDGAPARGLGGTADLIAHAHDQQRALVIMDPVRRTVTRLGHAAQPDRAADLGDHQLDAARVIGDPIADPVVSDYLACHGARALGVVTGTLFRSHRMPEDHPLVAAYRSRLGDVELGNPELIARGQRLFALYGPEVLLVLGCCSLPLAFAAGNGVQTIYRARRLEDEPLQRVYDTAQMVINVMQIDGLAAGNVGWRATRKVRLIHAIMRRLVQLDVASPWSEHWGTPINQEDLAGTLLSFSVAVLHGLRRMGARISTDEANGYVYAWSAVGRLLGVDEALLAATEQDALVLAERIGRRQIRATPEGQHLAAQLMKAVSTLFPLGGYANSLTHFFLKGIVFGDDVAQALQLPEPDWTEALVAARTWQKRKILALLHIVPGARRRRRLVARRFVQKMIRRKRPGHDVPFEIPLQLARSWCVAPSRDPGARQAVSDERREDVP